jgi:hypothetical protein
MVSLRAAGSFATRTQNRSGWNFPRGDVNVRAAVGVVNCEIMIERENVVEKMAIARAAEHSLKTAPGKGLRWVNAWR